MFLRFNNKKYLSFIVMHIKNDNVHTSIFTLLYQVIFKLYSIQLLDCLKLA